MGLLEKIFGGRLRDPAAGTIFKTLTAYSPVFITRGGALYESELVRSAIDARARHIGKLKIELLGAAQPAMKAKLERAPNPWQTWYQFLYRTSTILDMQNTVFIVPMLDGYDRVTGCFPVLPSRCEVVEYGGEEWLRFRFSGGDAAAVELRRCTVLTKFQYESDIYGSDNNALAPTIDLIDIRNQGITEAVKNASSYKFAARVSNFSFAEDLKKERERFTKENFGEEAKAGGVLLFPNTYSDIKQLQAGSYTVDAAQMEQIRTNVFNYFGVNEEILQNKAFGDSWNAFYEGAVETFAIPFSEGMTRALFTENEQARGNRLMATSNRLQYMSNKEKLSVSTQLVDRAILNRDDAREIWNLSPLPDGKGQKFYIRGEYKGADEETALDEEQEEDSRKS